MEPPPPNNRIKVDNLETYVHLLLCTSLNVNASIEAHNQTNRVNFDDRIFCRFCLNEKKKLELKYKQNTVFKPSNLPL